MTIVVFTDGSCSALDTIVNNVQHSENYTWSGPVPQGLKIVKVDTASEETGDAFLTLLVENDKNEQSLYYYKVPSADEEAILAPHIGVIHLRRDNVQLLNTCVVQGNSGLVLLSICRKFFFSQLMNICNHRLFPVSGSDSRIMRQDIVEHGSESDVGHFMEMINFVKLDKPFSICSPAKNYIAMYAGNAAQEGASLMLYNIQYSIIEAKQNFKVLFNNSRLWTLGSNILLAMGQSLSVFPFYVAEEELLHLIGSMKCASIQERATVQNDMIDEGSEEQNLIEFKQNMPPGSYSLEKREKPLTSQGFDELVDTLLGTTAVRLFEAEDEATTRVVLNENPEEGVLSLPVRTLVKALESQGYSEMEITNELVPQLISHGGDKDLMVVLRKFTTLSEGVIVECLKKGIRSDDKALLGLILSIEFEEEYLTSHLRKKLAIEDVLFLAQYLYKVLSGTVSCAEVDEVDLSEVVLRWLMCLIDAHYTNILLSKSKEMVKEFTKWRVLIEQHIEGLQKLTSFSAMVERMAQAKSTIVKPTSKWYNIEVIRI